MTGELENLFSCCLSRKSDLHSVVQIKGKSVGVELGGSCGWRLTWRMEGELEHISNRVRSSKGGQFRNYKLEMETFSAEADGQRKTTKKINKTEMIKKTQY